MSQVMTERDDVPELEEMLATMCENGIRHLHEAEADLMQAMFIFDEAIEKIGQHFTAIHQAVAAQQAGLDALLLQPALFSQSMDDKAMDDFRDLRGVIGDEVNAAVIGLQFHDLTSQLIARAASRTRGLRDLLLVFKTHAEDIGTALEPADVVRLLGDMGEKLKASDAVLDSGMHHSVQQRHLGCGEIELF